MKKNNKAPTLTHDELTLLRMAIIDAINLRQGKADLIIQFGGNGYQKLTEEVIAMQVLKEKLESMY